MKFLHRCHSFLVVSLLAFLPVTVFAEDTTFRTFVLSVVRPIVNGLLGVLYALALLMFLWGVARFILNAGDEMEREKGKKFIVWGLIALFVLTTFYAFVYILAGWFFGVTGPTYLPEAAW